MILASVILSKCKEFLQNIEILKLGPDKQATLSQPITVKEMSNALKEMANDKKPGLDGFYD